MGYKTSTPQRGLIYLASGYSGIILKKKDKTMKSEIGIDPGYVILVFVIIIGVIAVLVKKWEQSERRKYNEDQNESDH